MWNYDMADMIGTQYFLRGDHTSKTAETTELRYYIKEQYHKMVTVLRPLYVLYWNICVLY